MTPVFRFAPSPNGFLHLGHAYSALYTERAAEAIGGTVLLRIEDIDPLRCKPEFETALRQDLDWLGIAFSGPVWRQSLRLAAYEDAARRLREMDLLFPCFCSRGEVAVRATGADPDGAPLYPGTCAGLSPHDVRMRLSAGEPVQWRLIMAAAIARTGPLSILAFHPEHGPDARGTESSAAPERWGDVVVVRKDTPTSYHLSVVVDDAAQGVTHVTRGADLLAATDVHRVLQSLLGLRAPLYAHHRLVLDGEAQKLSKSRGSPSLRSLREAGWTSTDIRRVLGFE